jgi:hypothetical protein
LTISTVKQASCGSVVVGQVGWRPWTRVVLRRRADAFASATTKLDDTTRDRRDAETTLRRAQQDVETAEQRLEAVDQHRTDRDTELRELLDSRPYRDAVKAAGRVEGLRREVNSLDGQLTSARGRLEAATAATGRAREQAASARKRAAAAEDKVRNAGDDLLGAAEAAGLVESARRHLPDRDVDALTADHAVRAKRFAELRRLRGEHAKAERQAESSAEAVERAARARSTAIAEETDATAAVERQAEALRQEIRAWSDAAVVARCPDDQTEAWCDAVAELTVIDPETGSVLPGQSVIESMRAQVTAVRGDLAKRQEQPTSGGRRSPIVTGRLARPWRMCGRVPRPHPRHRNCGSVATGQLPTMGRARRCGGASIPSPRRSRPAGATRGRAGRLRPPRRLALCDRRPADRRRPAARRHPAPPSRRRRPAGRNAARSA